MEKIVSLDGTKAKLEKQDLNKDGKISEVELITRRHEEGIQDIVTPSELGEVMKEINDDTVDPSTRMTSIDMKTRLHPVELSPILAVDTLVALRFLPINILHFTRQKKRLMVSSFGEGRKEMVNISVGKREQDEEKKGWLNKLFNRRETT